MHDDPNSAPELATHVGEQGRGPCGAFEEFTPGCFATSGVSDDWSSVSSEKTLADALGENRCVHGASLPTDVPARGLRVQAGVSSRVGIMSRRYVAVVPHTHWDREWYESYQTFRMKLVDLLDELLPLMERDPSYRRFLLDGQMAVVDDYLEVRPEAEERIRALAASGRLTMGPWYILMDEFLVSAETMVRNLQMGIVRGAAFGGVMEVGYLPDMFGHIAQMPQILAQAGLTDTVLWRGVPSAITKTGFTWVAPDGSSVRAEYMPVGYGNGAGLPNDAKLLIQRATNHIDEIGEFLGDSLLWMNGSDHLMPQAHLGRVLAEANDLQEDYQFEITSLPEYLATVPREGLETWHGELRSGFRSNVLMGVTSNRVDVKLAAGRVERLLERRAEPLAALLTDSSSYPARLLELAWREVIRNSAHDSICACSVDDVVDAVLHRFAEARAIGAGVEERALDQFARSFTTTGTYVFNSTQRDRAGIVEYVVTGDDLDEDITQVMSEQSRFPAQMDVDGDTLRAILGLLNGPRITDDTWIHAASCEDLAPDHIALTVKIGATPNPHVELEELRRDLYTRVGEIPTLRATVTLDQPRIRRVAVLTEPIAGYGWDVLRPAAPTHRAVAEVCNVDGVSSVALSNGLRSVIIDPTNGTFAIDGVAGFGQLVDEGDLGDSYNYSPPATDTVVDAPTSVAVTTTLGGPLRASATITSTYTWPERIDPMLNRRVGSVTVAVVTTVELCADDPTVHVTTTFVNPAADHRLRILLPLPEATDHSVAECAFGTVERGLVAEGRPDELGLATYPSRRFVQAGGLTVVHEGLNEYELIDRADDDSSASTMALTLVRATGMLSRLGMKYRPFPAGPLTPVEGLQMVGKRITATYHLGFGDLDPYGLADAVLHPLDVVHAEGGGTRDKAGRAFTITGAEVSAIRREAGALEVRVFNPHTEETTVDLGLARGWICDLRGRAVEPFDGMIRLAPHRFATLRFTHEGSR